MQIVPPKRCPDCKLEQDRCIAKCGCGQLMVEHLGGPFLGYAFYVSEINWDAVVELFKSKKKFGQVGDYRVKLDHAKFNLFQSNRKCAWCQSEVDRCILIGTFKREYVRTRLIWCSADYKTFTIDHILARARGGLDNEGNFQTMCWTCNVKKSVDDDPQRSVASCP